MSTKEILHTLLAHAFTVPENSFDKKGLKPVRDWLLGILLFVVLLSVGGVFSAYQFMHYLDTSVEKRNDTQRVQSYNKSAVEEVLRVYGLKKQGFLDLKQSNVQILVPAAVSPVATTTLPVTTSTVGVAPATTTNSTVEIAN